MIIDDDHIDQLLYTDKGIPHVYVPDHGVNMASCELHTRRLGVGRVLGPARQRVAAWLDHLATGRPCMLTTPREARDNLEVTLAIESAVKSGKTIKLPRT